MSMPPADPPPPAPDLAADVSAEWTTTREVSLECAGCGAAFVLSYKYRFVEGLAATVVRCPGCGHGREYYLPVNAFDVSVAASSPPSAI